MKDLKKYLVQPLVLIGALNWGFIGMFNYDVIATVLFRNEMLLRIVDSAIGIAAVICIIMMIFEKDK